MFGTRPWRYEEKLVPVIKLQNRTGMGISGNDAKDLDLFPFF